MKNYESLPEALDGLKTDGYAEELVLKDQPSGSRRQLFNRSPLMR